ncbi:MAG: penicillin-binding protein activator [Alphaproteobacteria bacterium]|nr:penicillin-binding protein activator [Alphaproteobacteria bacterium SS10]
MAALAVLVLISACAGPAGPRPAGQEFSQQGQRPGGATRVAGPVNNPQAQSQPAPDSVFGATTDPQTRPRTRPVKVGLLLPLTGRGSDVGQALFNAAQLAMFELADDNFVLIPRDTKGTPEGAQLAIQSLLAENVELVLGPLFSGSVGAVKPFAEDAGVNLIGFTTDWRLASQANRGRLGLEGGSGAYVMGILPFSQVDRVIAYAAAQGLQRLGILAPETLYADAVVTGALESAARYQVDVTKVSRYPDDVEDLRPVVQSFTDFEEREAALEQVKAELEKRTDTASRQALRQLQNADTYGDAPFDAALIVEGGARMSIIGPLLPFYDVDPRIVQLMGTGLWDDPALLREPTLEGAWFASPAVSQREAFETSYRQNFGSRPPRIATIAYDALALAAVLARRDVDFFSDEKEIRDAAWTSRIYRSDVLTNPNGFAGTDGIFRFRPDGLVERGLAIIEIGPEGFTVLDEAPDTFVEPAS